MLRKRSRSLQKDQNMGHSTMSDTGSDAYFQSDVLGPKHKTNSFFGVPGLFVGLTPKGLSDCDSVRSPTSPLDFRVFSNLGTPLIRSPRSSLDGHHKSWDCSKVGLSIIDSLGEDTKLSGNVIRSSESKNIIFGPQMRIRTPNFRTHHIDSFKSPKSLPKNYAIFPHTLIKSSNLQVGNTDTLFEIGEDPLEPEPFGKIRSCSLNSGSRSFSSLTSFADCYKSNLSSGNFCSENRTTTQVNSPPQFNGGCPNLNNFSHSTLTSVPISIGSGHELAGSLSASEIELSEDYTCVISHGPNPKTVHIYGDCILECHSNESTCFTKHEEEKIDLPPSVKCLEISSPFPLNNNFLSFCYSCKKKLEGEDIYMYRGEKAFCSLSCRASEILIDEEMEDSINDSSKNSPENHGDEQPQSGMFIDT